MTYLVFSFLNKSTLAKYPNAPNNSDVSSSLNFLIFLVS